MPSLTILLRVLIATLSFLSVSLADPPPFGPQDLVEYDKGGHGIYSEIKYRTSELISPHVLIREWDQACSNGEYYFLAPRGLLVGHPGPMMLGEDGIMVWHTEAWKVAYGVTVQKYRGEDYITFWSGNDQVIGHGTGYYYMLDKHYNQFKMIEPAGNLTGDLHEFKITPEHTALVTSYIPVAWDLTNVGEQGRAGRSFVWDCAFQEVDIETGKSLFEWRALDHFTFEDCYNPLKNMGAPNNPWDWFHINSVDKDKRGNYLISSRYSHSLIYINGRSGDVLWQLGGKNCSFSDLSDGDATNFAWQHDGRWVEEFKSISIFDNAAYFGNQTKQARGLIIEVDLDRMEAKVQKEALHPRKYISESQGSMQVLDDGRMFVGYGSASAFTEFDSEGNLQCDIQYGALHFHKNGDFSPSAVMSYRIYKHAWKGYPSEDPRVKFDGPRMYVSWNGATELRTWMLEGSVGAGSREKDWNLIDAFPRTGFESNTTVDDSQWRVYRLTAFDADEKILGLWRVYSAGEVMQIPLPSDEQFNPIFFVVVGALLALALNYTFRRRHDLCNIGYRMGIHSRSTSGNSSEDDEYMPLNGISYGNKEAQAIPPGLTRSEADRIARLTGSPHFIPTLKGDKHAESYLSPQVKQY